MRTSGIILIFVLLAGVAAANPPKMKMTTRVPPGIATPDKLETRLGTLHLFDAVPDAETAKKVYDNLDFQRGVQAYLCLANSSSCSHWCLKQSPTM